MVGLHRRSRTPVTRLLLLAAAGSACATASPEDTALRPVTTSVRLVVENRGFSDHRLYAILHDASRFPLGTVEALATRRVLLPAPLIAARTIRLVAVPMVLGPETAIDVEVYGGDTLIWYLQNEPAFSRLVKR
jgi:hypothetical protein